MDRSRAEWKLAVAALVAITWARSARADDPTSTQAPPPPPARVDTTTPPTPPPPPPPAILSRDTSAPAPPVTDSPAPRGTTAATATSENPSPDNGRFEFGSYGRVNVASDLRGGTGRPANVVSHGTRIDEDSYAELELRREDTFKDDIRTKVVATLAFFPPFFHFSGEATQAVAMRNLYAQATYGDWTMWAGSRMYRGDDIYLLDWWPLDNQNTVGGGFGTRLASDTTIAAHVGMQRLDNSYQYEQIQAVSPFGFGSSNVTLLDRPRVVESLKVTQFFRNEGHHRYSALSDKAGLKAILYGEAHEMAAGVYQDPTTNLQKPLPNDNGFLVGAELAYWTGERDTFVQLFVRHARGLAAYDPLASPDTFANDTSTAGASETMVAIGGNWEHDWLGVLYGGYVRFFRDAGPAPTSMMKYDEGAIVARPQIFIGDHWGIALEGSYQERRYAYLDPNTNGPLVASEWRGGVIPYFSPSGRGSYKRPQLRIIYAATARNAGARELYPREDVFSQRQVEQFLGVGAEWWFNSSSYP